VAPELANELRLLAGWLELEQVSVARKGHLPGKLAKAVAAAPGRRQSSSESIVRYAYAMNSSRLPSGSRK
jgi:hypothetical protein